MSPKPSLGSVLCESIVEFLAERVLFQDDVILAVDKPEGVAAIPGGGEQESVLTQLQDSLFGKLFVVHRLDKEVSGVMIFARTLQAHRSLSRQFSAHQAQKTYVALVHGELADNDGLIDKPLRAFGSGRVGVCEDGKPSVTRFASRSSNGCKATPSCMSTREPVVGTRSGSTCTQMATRSSATGAMAIGRSRVAIRA